MKISTKGRYGLRILFDLALNPDEAPRMIKDIAAAQGISQKYISRLIIALRQAGLVKSVRGAKGGYRLARFPKDITLLEVVEVMEGRIGLVDCVSEPDACKRIPSCAVRQIWAKLNDQIRVLMTSVTLQTLLDKHGARNRAGHFPDYCI